MKINEKTEIKLDLKTIISVIVVTASFVGMYFTLHADIEEAKQLPPSEVERVEYDMKQEWQENHIQRLEDDVDELYEPYKELDRELHHKADASHISSIHDKINKVEKKSTKPIVINQTVDKKNKNRR